MNRMYAELALAFVLAPCCAAAVAAASEGAPASVPSTADCPSCAEWTVPQQPFRIYGNTYFVGTEALSSILVASAAGHVLIDGTVAEAVPQIVANIRALGFRVEDIRVILNSHVHFDHAGGIAALQRMSGARVYASPSSAAVLRTGRSGADDPQFKSLTRGLDPVRNVTKVADGQVIAVGPLRLTARFTPGHTPGGTSWTWESCEQSRCLHLVYADSLSAISAPDFQFSHNTAYPQALTDFAHSFAALGSMPCDILLTPHPEASGMPDRLRRREVDHERDAFIERSACAAYAARARADLETRLARERQAH